MIQVWWCSSSFICPGKQADAILALIGSQLRRSFGLPNARQIFTALGVDT